MPGMSRFSAKKPQVNSIYSSQTKEKKCLVVVSNVCLKCLLWNFLSGGNTEYQKKSKIPLASTSASSTEMKV